MQEQSPTPPNAKDIQPIREINKRTIEEAIAYDYDFDVMDIISRAWAKVNGVKLPFFLALLVISVINYVVTSILGLIIGFLPPLISLPIILVVNLSLAALSASFMIMGLKRLRGDQIEIKQCFSSLTPIFMVLVIANILVGILVTIGFVLIIIPGIYLAVSYTLVQWIIIDNPGIKPWQALEASRKIVTKHWFKVFLLGLALGFILSISAIPLGIGLIWTFPLAVLSIGILYQTIFEK